MGYNNINFTFKSNALFNLRKIILMNRLYTLSNVGILAFFWLFPASLLAQDAESNKTLTTIAFGSCSRQDLPQVMWPFVLNQNPDLWIWVGDNIYGDSEDMKVMKAKYNQQKAEANYQKMLKQMEIVGIWDDHDYGVNDGGKEFPKRAQSRDLMFDFLDVPKSHPAWKREGGYQSYVFGRGERKVKVILLDARYFRDPIERKNRKYLPNEEGDILGEDQWAWLEKELTNSDAAVHILASGVQLVPEDHPYEKWANLPKARQRLFDLVAKTKPSRTFHLSGDRHIAEISSMEVPGYGPFYDFTSSGLTHSYSAVGDEPNRHRVGKLIGDKNFGLIQLDWNNNDVKVTFQIRGQGDKVLDEIKPVLKP